MSYDKFMRSTLLLSALMLIAPLGLWSQSFEEKMISLVKQEVNAKPETYGLSLADVNEATVSSLYTTSHNQVTHVYLSQNHSGIPLHGAILSAHIAEGKVVSVTHRFASNMNGKVNTSTPVLSAEEALNAAAAHLNLTDYNRINLEERATGVAQRTVFQAPGLSNESIPVQLSYAKSGNQIRLAWEARIYTADYAHW